MHTPCTPPRPRRPRRLGRQLAALVLALASWLTITASATLAASATAAGHHRAHHKATAKRCPASSTKRGKATSSSARPPNTSRQAAPPCKKAQAPTHHGGSIPATPRKSGPTVTSDNSPADWPLVTSPLSPASSEAPGAREAPDKATHRSGGQPGESGGASGGAHPGEGAGREPEETNGVLTDPIDPRFLTEVPFGASSFWIQPWRAYLDTWPASTLLGSLGINFNVGPTSAEPVARLLQESGFKLARKEIPWGSLSYEHPTEFDNEPRIRAILTALHNHGLRPLIMLNANSGQPVPVKQSTLTTLAAAAAGASTVKLDAASAAKVVPGKTGFDELTFGTGPDVLITAVSAGDVATLSRPLTKPLPAGKHRATTLRYAPFQPPTLANGTPNPVFQETLAGWLSYVATVCKEAESIFGPEGYDLEVWNELTFGSQFLNYEHYYQPTGSGVEPNVEGGPEAAEDAEDAETEESPESRENSDALDRSEADVGSEPTQNAKVTIDKEVTKEIRRALLKETIAYVRNPANGIPAGVGISDGFASQTPFPSGADTPGLTALSKHLYNGAKTYPAAYPNNHVRPLNALGIRDTEPGDAFKPLFIPSYQSLSPELMLTGSHTETITRDIAPITTDIYGQPHGRNVGPAGASPVQKWMTEYNLSPGRGKAVGPDGVTPANVSLSVADKAHFQAKALLRSLAAMVNKGMSREYFFAAAPGALSLISNSFFAALEANPETYPGTAVGGETMTGFRNMLSRFQGAGPGSELRQLKLLSIAQEGNHAQFTGDGTAAHPDLYDRDMLAVLPFQSSPTRFVIPVYVMTLDLLTLYEPNQPASDVNRFDLPNEAFRITLGNLPETSNPPSVSAYDPLRDESTPAQLLSRKGNTAEFEVAATDYPRLLSIEY